MSQTTRRYLPFTLTLLVIFLDRLTKIAVSTHMRLNESIPLLGNLVRLTYVRNQGIVFGYHVIGMNLLRVVSVIAVIVVTWILVRSDRETPAMRWILAGILGGAVGNTFDRIVFGYVIDFIDVDMPNWIMDRFAIFNVADSAVSVGVTLLLLLLLFQRPQETEPGQLPPVDNAALSAPDRTATHMEGSGSGGYPSPAAEDEENKG